MKRIIFTVDVEEFFHTENISEFSSCKDRAFTPARAGIGIRKLIDLLESRRQKATFFVLGCFAEKNKNLIKELIALGHEIASHGYRHVSLYKQGLVNFENDLRKSIQILEDISGEKVIGFRAPNFSLNQDCLWLFDALRKQGLVYDSSISSSSFFHKNYFRKGAINLYSDNKGIFEIPVSTFDFFCFKLPLGGGYFRACPYFLVESAITRQLLPKDSPVVFYIHPWELDPKQPRFSLPISRYLRHYFNLKSTESKLKRLLEQIEFIPIREFLSSHKDPAAGFINENKSNIINNE